MIKGIIIFEDGTVQQVGELTNLQAIITRLEILLPELKEQWLEFLISNISPEQIDLIKEKSSKGKE